MCILGLRQSDLPPFCCLRAILTLATMIALGNTSFSLADDDAAADNVNGSAGFIDMGAGPLPLEKFRPSLESSSGQTKVAKPTHVILAAELASWDADAEPDGWRCQVQLLDQFDAPCGPASAYASFELRLRVPRRDHSGFRDLRTETIRWSERLDVNTFGVAEVKLPLRLRLPSFYLDSEPTARISGSRSEAFQRPDRATERFRATGLIAGKGVVLTRVVAPPLWGVMVVRVTVAAVGVLEAIDAVLVDEPLLVDSQWPQR